MVNNHWPKLAMDCYLTNPSNTIHREFVWLRFRGSLKKCYLNSLMDGLMNLLIVTI